jgi:hypothetical protein
VLLVVLVGAFLAGMNWLIHSAAGPTASPTQVPTPALTSAPALAAQPTTAPTAIPTPRPTVAPTMTPAPTITPAPTVAPTVEPTVAAALNTDWWDWSSDQIDPVDEQQALAAVDADWANLANAWWYLDGRKLADTETEPALGEFTAILQERRLEGRSQKVDVERSGTTVHYLDQGLAVVYETYTNHSVAVNFTTGEPVEPMPNDSQAASYLLRKVNGVYKVAEIAHHNAQQNP